MGSLKRTILSFINLKPTDKKRLYTAYKDKKKTYCLEDFKEKYWYKFNLRMSIQITLETSRKDQLTQLPASKNPLKALKCKQRSDSVKEKMA
jgi:hypothetical protein